MKGSVLCVRGRCLYGLDLFRFGKRAWRGASHWCQRLARYPPEPRRRPRESLQTPPGYPFPRSEPKHRDPLLHQNTRPVEE